MFYNGLKNFEFNLTDWLAAAQQLHTTRAQPNAVEYFRSHSIIYINYRLEQVTSTYVSSGANLKKKNRFEFIDLVEIGAIKQLYYYNSPIFTIHS